MQPASFPARRLIGVVFGVIAGLCAQSALASFQSDITVRLIAPGGNTADPTPVNLSQVVTVANLATGIHANDGSPIGGTGDVMIAQEEVVFVGNSIRVTAFSGYEDPTTHEVFTGWLGSGGQHARYEFDGLSIAGKTIVGFNVFTFDSYAGSGFNGLANPVASDLVHLIDADTLTLDLDSIIFAARPNIGNGEWHADFRIELITRDADPGGGGTVPEPASLALFLAAALGARAARRRA